jgi:hypothetical protein
MHFLVFHDSFKRVVKHLSPIFLPLFFSWELVDYLRRVNCKENITFPFALPFKTKISFESLKKC